MKKKILIKDTRIQKEDIKIGSIFQNSMFSPITGRIIDKTMDNIKLWVTDSETKEESDLWYTIKTINDFWQLQYKDGR